MAGRNVILRDFDGNTIAGFWKYGSTSWNTFLTLLPSLIYTTDLWSIFDFHASSPNRHGKQRSASDEIVSTRVYILLREDGSPTDVLLTDAVARPRQPTHSNTPARARLLAFRYNASEQTVRQTDHYRQRTHDRDGKYLLTDLQSHTWRQLKAAHVFPRVHDVEDCRLVVRLYPKCDFAAKDNYEIGVNPDDNYKVTAFIEHHGYVHGLTLQLDHIADPNLRPLDELFRDHFLQGVLKNMKGAGEPTWDYEDNLGDGAFDLSRHKIWGNSEVENDWSWSSQIDCLITGLRRI